MQATIPTPTDNVFNVLGTGTVFTTALPSSVTLIPGELPFGVVVQDGHVHVSVQFEDELLDYLSRQRELSGVTVTPCMLQYSPSQLKEVVYE